MLSKNWGQFAAEFIGTFFLVFMGCGSVILSQINPEGIDPLAIPFLFGGTVAIMIYAVGHISGAHFNPAVTLSFALTRKFPFKKVLPYLVAQFTGAIMASFLHKIMIGGNIHDFGATQLSTSLAAGVGLEFVLSFLLMFVIISVATDTRAVGEMAGLSIGTTVTLCALLGGPLTGASMNPARSLGPALLSGSYQYLWVYLVIPCIAAPLGAWVYEKIRCYRPENSEDSHGCC